MKTVQGGDTGAEKPAVDPVETLGRMATADDESLGADDAPGGDEAAEGAEAEDQDEKSGEEAEEGTEGAEESEGEAGDDDGKPKDEDAESEDDLSKLGTKGLLKRVGKLTAQKHEAREKAEAAEARAKQAELAAMEPMALHVDLLTTDERKLIAEASALEDRRAFLRKQVRKGDYEDPKDPKKNLTVDEMEDELEAIDRQGGKIARAQGLYEERRQEMLEAMRIGLKLLRTQKAKAGETTTRQPDQQKRGPTAKAGAATTGARTISAASVKAKITPEEFKKRGGDNNAAAALLGRM